MGDAPPALYTIEEAARLLRVGRTKAYAMTQEWRATGGRSGLPVVDFGNVLRVPRHALEQLLGVDLTHAVVDVERDRDAEDAPNGTDKPDIKPQHAIEERIQEEPIRTSRRSRRSRNGKRPSNQLDLFDPASS